MVLLHVFLGCLLIFQVFSSWAIVDLNIMGVSVFYVYFFPSISVCGGGEGKEGSVVACGHAT